MMSIRGIRGAITTEENTKESILSNTRQLLQEILKKNNIQIDDIASIFFSVTDDLNATFPALSAREMGLTTTPLLCLNEIKVPASLPHCIRILMHVNTDIKQSKLHHIYLKGAVVLRSDHN
jgi:chorismate mutase